MPTQNSHINPVLGLFRMALVTKLLILKSRLIFSLHFSTLSLLPITLNYHTLHLAIHILAFQVLFSRQLWLGELSINLTSVLLVDQMAFLLLSLKMLVPPSANLLPLFSSCCLITAAFLHCGLKPILQQFIKKVIALFLLIIDQFH